MASVRVRWRPEEVSFTVDDAATEAGVWTILVHAPGCTLTVMTDEWQESPDGTRITLPGVHIQGARQERNRRGEPANHRRETLRGDKL
jgi:hypothetical protein